MKIESYEHVHESMGDFSPLVFGKVKVKAYELILVVSYANEQLLFSGFLLVFIFTPSPQRKKRRKVHIQSAQYLLMMYILVWFLSAVITKSVFVLFFSAFNISA